MFKQDYNQPYYLIHLVNIEDEKISVLKFEGEEKISGLYKYEIDIVSKDMELDSSKIINNAAVFSFVRGQEKPEEIHGMISQFEQYGRNEEYAFYRLILVPRLWALNLVFQNEIYQQADISDIIKKIMTDAGFSKKDYKIDLKNTYTKQEYVVQYRETNYDFLNRRLEYFGIFYYFDNSNNADVVVFTDSNSRLPSINSADSVEFNENLNAMGNDELIFNLSLKEKVVTGSVKLKDYNYMFPEKQLIGESKLSSGMPGNFYDYGENFETENEAGTLAKVRNQELLSHSKIFYGLTDNRLFRAGHRFKLSSHFRNDWNSEYILLDVSIKGFQLGMIELLHEEKSSRHFECIFKAMPFDIDYRPERKTPIPKISGIMSARIESGDQDEYAFIDDHGRYKAKMLFDLSDKTNGEASLPIRLSQGYSGPGYGIHFPNHKNTELIFACVDGDVDRPVGLGTIPNPSQAAPVVSKNKTQSIIRTAAGNEFLIEDKKDETLISLTTKDQNRISLDDKDDKIEITTKDKHTILMDDKNKAVSIWTKDGHNIILDDENKNIVIFSKNEHFIVIDDNDGGEKIEISDKDQKNSFTIDITNNKIVMETKEGNIDILAPKGEVHIKSTTLKIETEGDTTINAANLKTETKMDTSIKALNIKQEAEMEFKQKGLNVTSEAELEHKSKGLNNTVEAGVNTQIKGTLVTVQSTGPNTIKGMPVLIN